MSLTLLRNRKQIVILLTFGFMLLCIEVFILKSNADSKCIGQKTLLTTPWPKYFVVSKERFPSVWSFSSKWNRRPDVCENVFNLTSGPDFVLAELNSVVKDLKMFTHNPKGDYISSEVQKNQNFEPQNFKAIHKLLTENKDANVIDIGSNIGIISLQAAAMGRRVLSLDAAISNIQHVCASVMLNKEIGKENINLIHNAVSDNHTQVSFVMGNNGEFGASFVDEEKLRKHKIENSFVSFDTQNLVNVNTVLLDDLLELPLIKEFKTVFIKMDVEGFEHKVLGGARKLFQTMNILGILMEWRWHVKRPDTKSVILKFMEDNKFEPYKIDSDYTFTLDGQKMNESDVMWLPMKRDVHKDV